MRREYMREQAGPYGEAGSPWLVNDAPEHAPLSGERQADAVVVGGGLTGALVAAQLADRGMRVTVLERGRIVGCTTGHSTAKVTALHGTDWSTIVRTRGAGPAVAEWAARNVAVPRALGELVAAKGIACRFRLLDGYLVERASSTGDALATEWNALRALGMPVNDAETYARTPLGAAIGLRMPGQAQFDPAAFTAGLIATLPAGRSWVHELTPVRSIEPAPGGWMVSSDGGAVHAQIVVMASLAPARDPALLFARLFPHAHYALEMQPVTPPPDGMWIEAGGAGLTARPTDEADGRWILSGTSARLASTPDEYERYDSLLGDVATGFVPATPTRFWSAEDFSTPDGLPFIGGVGSRDGLYYIGGFGGWGMTKAPLAAMLIADEIEGIAPRTLMRLLSPNRFPVFGAWRTLLRENISTARYLLHPQPAQRSAVVASPPVITRAGEAPPRCTHMGCRTKVNTAEGTIDCPCHGSRFSPDGEVVYGPARYPAG